MLLYLVKYSRPDIANATRELTKCMQKANPAAMKEMLRVIKFVLDTRNLGLKLEPFPMRNQRWDLMAYSDADWAGDRDTRRSVTGYAIYFMGCLVCWKSKQQQSVSLSTAEAEYYALSEAAKEIKFVAQILMTLDLPITLPIICRVDNVGAIFMAENVTATARTKHIDLRIRFIAEFVEEGFMKIIFVKSEDNLSDGLTKNVSKEIYERHREGHVGSKESVEKDTMAQRVQNSNKSTTMTQKVQSTNRKGVGDIGRGSSPTRDMSPTRDSTASTAVQRACRNIRGLPVHEEYSPT
jgi:hypothetical protein